jgi:hypothetical protein
VARPPKNPEDRKSYQLHIPLTAAERALIERAVGLRRGRDKAGWAREVLLGEAERMLLAADVPVKNKKGAGKRNAEQPPG